MAAAADWDLTPYFSSLGGKDYLDFRDGLEREIAALSAQIETLPPIGKAGARDAWVALLQSIEQLQSRSGHLSSYLHCHAAADARDEAVQREMARRAALDSRLEKLNVLLRAHLAGASDAEFDALIGDERLAGAGYFLRRERVAARQSMAPALEALAADLAVDGLSAWGRLYDQITGQLTFEMAVPGRAAETLPVSMTRTLLDDVDEEVRGAAFAGATAAWEGMAGPIAACLNAISGTRLTLYRRRGIPHYLEPALFDSAIERRTLDAMWSAVRARQEVPRRYLLAKAKLLGRERLRYCDVAAPLRVDGGGGGGRVTWDQGSRRVVDAFASIYPALAELARRALSAKWIDHTPRAGKRPGGFCTSSHLLGQSRVFMTYHGGSGDVGTLAHELGHAFHNWVMRDMRSFSRHYPMTLAETASTFAEQVVAEATLSHPDATAAERLGILDARLRDAAIFLLNIPMRFDFECALYEEREGGELSVSRLCELMLAAQRKNYGDCLDPGALDPWYWASKLHFYITEVSFYNFPYTFGFLFSLGIFARARAEGPEFLPRFERLLRRTGTDTAETLAREELGVDLGGTAFWDAAIDLVAADLDRFLASAK